MNQGGGQGRPGSDQQPLVRGKSCFWDPKKVAAGRVRGVAVGEGLLIERKQSVPAKFGRIRGVAAGEGGRI